MICIGVDPGESGGIAIIDDARAPQVMKTSETPYDILAMLEAVRTAGPCFAFIEKLQVFPGMSAGQLKGMCKLFRGQGILLGLIQGARIPVEEVGPPVWQRAMGCLTKGDKKISYRKAQELFPNVKVAHWNADALLIAEHCRRTVNQRNGIQPQPRGATRR